MVRLSVNLFSLLKWKQQSKRLFIITRSEKLMAHSMQVPFLNHPSLGVTNALLN
jgi:hypothetical protein